MNKFLIQLISRYQDALPVTHIHSAQEGVVNKHLAIEVLCQYNENMWPEEAEELLKNGKVMESDSCWAIWGEEQDILITKIS